MWFNLSSKRQLTTGFIHSRKQLIISSLELGVSFCPQLHHFLPIIYYSVDSFIFFCLFSRHRHLLFPLTETTVPRIVICVLKKSVAWLILSPWQGTLNITAKQTGYPQPNPSPGRLLDAKTSEFHWPMRGCSARCRAEIHESWYSSGVLDAPMQLQRSCQQFPPFPLPVHVGMLKAWKNQLWTRRTLRFQRISCLSGAL